MALKFSVQYDLLTATFYQEEVTQFTGKTRQRFCKINWTLFNQSNQTIAFYIRKHKPFSFDAKLLVDYCTKEESIQLVLFYQFWKGPHMRFVYKNDQFLIAFHRGNKFSLFKNEKQFATLEKQAFSFGGNKKLKVTADADTSPELLSMITYAVLIITEDETETDSDFSIDVGILWRELRRFDETWKAKNI